MNSLEIRCSWRLDPFWGLQCTVQFQDLDEITLTAYEVQTVTPGWNELKQHDLIYEYAAEVFHVSTIDTTC